MINMQELSKKSKQTYHVLRITFFPRPLNQMENYYWESLGPQFWMKKDKVMDNAFIGLFVAILSQLSEFLEL